MDNKIDIQLSDISEEFFKFDTLTKLYNFINDEYIFWKKKYDSFESAIDDHVITIFRSFKSAIDMIDNWDDLDSWDENTINNQIRNQLINGSLRNLASYWLHSGNSVANSYVECFKKYGKNGASAFLDFLIRKKIDTHKLSNINSFSSVIEAYEFSHPDTDIIKRKKSEKISLGLLKKKFSVQTEELTNSVAQIKKEYEDWFTENSEKNEKLSKISKYLISKKSQRFNEKKYSMIKDWNQSFEELKSTYEEKLRLSEPAHYWKKSASKYKRQGLISVSLLFVLLLCGFMYLSDFFLVWLSGKNQKISINTIQGVVILASLLATFAFSIKILSKLTFSAFHLMRDSEEREQLTYLYLSLSKDNPDILESRELILQALFSRSETGLLSNENGPTMPAIAEALRILNKNKTIG
ncbi:DUF6161 domain-containing protein [Marinicella sp. W31]|uniref:DUF6161 domain-containing protein n=1 Tax=Marinicella sp. W31 TaxID=3023713 RepID=UPI0037566992